MSPSPIDAGLIWAGTDDGLIHLTRDGGRSWQDVTPPQLVPWAKVSLIEASHFDRDTAWAAINTFRLDDTRPHMLRTRDGGRTWLEVTGGMPPDEGVVNAVREDPKRRDLLFAGTERQVWVSFDGGEGWQSLRANMPATSVRDLVVKGDDLVAGTHGRGFFILDDITPLRQLDANVLGAPAHLFAPQEALRWRANKNTDTPLPPDEPAAPNPPEGAIVHYRLQAAAHHVALELRDAAGRLVRRYASDDRPEEPVPGRNIPDYWIRPPQNLSAEAGLHRFVWDLREAVPKPSAFGYPMTAIRGDTPREPRGPWVPPGTYTVRLLVGGRAQEQPLAVRMDPRVKTAPSDLESQHALAQRLCAALSRLAQARRPGAQPDRPDPAPRLSVLHAQLTQLLQEVEEADLSAHAGAARGGRADDRLRRAPARSRKRSAMSHDVAGRLGPGQAAPQARVRPDSARERVPVLAPGCVLAVVEAARGLGRRAYAAARAAGASRARTTGSRCRRWRRRARSSTRPLAGPAGRSSKRGPGATASASACPAPCRSACRSRTRDRRRAARARPRATARTPRSRAARPRTHGHEPVPGERLRAARAHVRGYPRGRRGDARAISQSNARGGRLRTT